MACVLGCALVMITVNVALGQVSVASTQQTTELIRQAEGQLAKAPFSAIQTALAARRSASSIGSNELLARAYGTLGRAYTEVYKLDLALNCADSARILFRKLGLLAELFHSELLCGAIRTRAGDLLTAIAHQEEALTIATRLGDRKEIANARLALAYTHYVGRQPALAYPHLDTCAKVYRSLNDHKGLAETFMRRANTIAEDEELDSLPLALAYIDTALRWAKLARDSVAMTRVHINTALISMNNRDEVAASAHTDTALQLSRALRDSFLLVHAHENLGQLQIRWKKPDEARFNCKVMLEYGIRHGLLRLQRDAWHCIMKSCVLAEDWEAAYRAYERYIELKENMVGVQARELIQRRSLTAAAKRREEALQEAHHARMATMIITVVLVIVVLFAIGAYLIQRQKNRADQQKAKALRILIDRHFVGNAFASLGSFIYRGKKEQAYELTVSFDRFTRDILEHSSLELITLREELDALSNYLELERRISEDGFEYRIEVVGELDPSSVKFTPMLLQPWVENAVKHGVRPLRTGGRIVIQASIEHGMLKVSVWNNGVAITELPKEVNRRSWGIPITGARLTALRRFMGQEGTCDLVQVPEGTMVVLHIPVVHSRN
jgi:tetratricopeptide (TPR) repeat protein